MAKTVALISCTVTTQLICAFVFAYAKDRFSHDAALMVSRHVKYSIYCLSHFISISRNYRFYPQESYIKLLAYLCYIIVINFFVLILPLNACFEIESQIIDAAAMTSPDVLLSGKLMNIHRKQSTFLRVRNIAMGPRLLFKSSSF